MLIDKKISDLVPNDGEWHNIIINSDGSSDAKNIKLYYDKVINGIEYHVCEQNGKIISKTPTKDIIR